MIVSARTIYIFLASCIVLFFVGTGLYYFLDKPGLNVFQKTAPQASPTPRVQAKASPTSQPDTTPAPLESASPAPSAKPIQADVQTATDSATAKQTGGAANTLPKIAETNVSEPAPSSVARSVPRAPQCFDSCEYSYQCPGELECLKVDGQKRCVNIECTSNNTCNCSATPNPNPTTKTAEVFYQDFETVSTDTANDEEMLYEEEALLADTGGTSALTQTITNQVATSSTDTELATTIDYTYADLPKAGTPLVTFGVLFLGGLLSGIGVLWLKLRS